MAFDVGGGSIESGGGSIEECVGMTGSGSANMASSAEEVSMVICTVLLVVERWV